MPYPPLVVLASEAEYRDEFLADYCASGGLCTFDGVPVAFRPRHFSHAFYQAAGRVPGDKSLFSRERAERMDWINTALCDRAAKLFFGYDKKRKAINRSRRVSVSNGNYVVVIQFEKSGRAAVFVTAFCATPETLKKIESAPVWK